tara:strand:- start:2427 stop:2651 length:225 start_codon:yes stop_codon:yes gene_type:complete
MLESMPNTSRTLSETLGSSKLVVDCMIYKFLLKRVTKAAQYIATMVDIIRPIVSVNGASWGRLEKMLGACFALM